MRKFVKNILQFDAAWVVSLAGSSGLLLLFRLARLPFLLGHDVYFHVHASKSILSQFPHLPTTIPFYWDGFTYGYPPLFHFLVAGIAYMYDFSLESIFRWIPALTLSCAILLVYKLFKTVGIKYPIVAVTVYTMLLPFHWELFAGEYPRLLSSLFALLALNSYYLFKSKYQFRFGFLTSFFIACAILSNLIALGILGVFFIYESIREYIETKSISTIFIGVLSILFISPWIIHIVSQFGSQYVIDVLMTHQSAYNPLFVPFAIAFISGMSCIVFRKLPHGLVVLFLVAFLWAKPCFWVIGAGFILGKSITRYVGKVLERFALHIQSIIVGLTLLLLAITISGKYIYTDEYVNGDVVSATEWIKHTTPTDSKLIAFLNVPNTSSTMLNGLVGSLTGMTRDENLPYFTNRRTYTWYGYEWNTNAVQLEKYKTIHKKACAETFKTLSKELHVRPDYIWINKDSPDFTNADVYCNDFNEPSFVTVYENDTILIKKFVLLPDCNCSDKATS